MTDKTQVARNILTVAQAGLEGVFLGIWSVQSSIFYSIGFEQTALENCSVSGNSGICGRGLTHFTQPLLPTHLGNLFT